MKRIVKGLCKGVNEGHDIPPVKEPNPNPNPNVLSVGLKCGNNIELGMCRCAAGADSPPVHHHGGAIVSAGEAGRGGRSGEKRREAGKAGEETEQGQRLEDKGKMKDECGMRNETGE